MKTLLCLLLAFQTVAYAGKRLDPAAEEKYLAEANEKVSDNALPVRAWKNEKGDFLFYAVLTGKIESANPLSPKGAETVPLLLAGSKNVQHVPMSSLSAEDQNYCQLVTDCLIESYPSPVAYEVTNVWEGRLSCKALVNRGDVRKEEYNGFILFGSFRVTVAPGQNFRSPLYWVGTVVDNTYSEPHLTRLFTPSLSTAIFMWEKKQALAQADKK